MNYQIRKIQKYDLPQVFKQLLELVEHEGLTANFKLTLERFEKEIFGKNADWHGLVAAKDDQILGFCLYSFANINRAFNLTPLIQIDDIFVQKECRGMGVAKKLLAELGRIAIQKGIDRIELWCVQSNQEGQNFYQSLKASKLDFLDLYQLDPKNLLE